MTWPSRLNSGPPELPGFTAASVWMKVTNECRCHPAADAPMALTTPAVTLFSKPNGEPMAITHWPGRSCAGIAEAHRRQAGGGDLDQRHVAALVDADDLGHELAPVGELDRHFRGIGDHVRIGEHVAVGTDDEPRADAMAWAACARESGIWKRWKNCDSGSSASPCSPGVADLLRLLDAR